MSYSSDSFLIKVYFNHKNSILIEENPVIIHDQRTWGGVRWELRNPSVYFFVTPLNVPPLIPVFPLQLCYICSILSHPWGMPWQRRMRRKRKGSASVLLPPHSWPHAGRRRRSPASRSRVGLSGDGVRVEISWKTGETFWCCFCAFASNDKQQVRFKKCFFFPPNVYGDGVVIPQPSVHRAGNVQTLPFGFSALCVGRNVGTCPLSQKWRATNMTTVF